jgi:hypothetical protein
MSRDHVEFSGRVEEELPEELRVRLKNELSTVFRMLHPSRLPERVSVAQVYPGHSPEFAAKVVLAVEVRYPDGYERHIVKIGERSNVEADYEGWQVCTRGRMVASRIFAPVQKAELPDDRFAVVYRDAFTLYGPDEDGQPRPLEEAVQWAMLDHRPDPLSAERAIAHVFTDLGLWFFPGAAVAPRHAGAFYADHLRQRPGDDPKDGVLCFWQDDIERKTLRRHAVWVLAGRDPPDADPVDKPARYLDPLDYVRWALAEPDGARLPPTLVGRSHGDLHARNVLVGVRRGELEYPAVFDYADMSDHNVLAWDFAKLETELKVRLLPAVLRDENALRWLLRRARVGRNPKEPKDTRPAIGVPSETGARADRLAAFLAFEELLDDLTKPISQPEDAELIRPFFPVPTGVQMLDRLAGILLRIRKEAALWLGFKKPKRQSLWKDELYFALAVYGLLNVRWDYSRPEQESALVSAGVAAARMPSVPKLLRRVITAGPDPGGNYPSYRVPLSIAHGFWRSNRHELGSRFLSDLVLEVVVDERPGEAAATRFEIRPQMWHAMPLIGEAILLAMETGQLAPAEVLLEDLRPLAREFQDYETLARLGRLFKDAGDRKWELLVVPFEQFHNHAACQMYRKALVVYEEAFVATNDWYTGINAATLALLTNDPEKSRRYAAKVAATCSTLYDHERRERYWLFATEGEAAILRGDDVQVAVDFYRHALEELSPGQWGMANSSYKQVCRLWKALGEDRVGRVLALFETGEVRGGLSHRFLGRAFAGDA